MIDFTYLEGKDGELVVKELAAVDSHSNRVSSYVFKKPYSWEELSLFKVRTKKLLTMGVIGMIFMYYIQSYKMCYIARHHLLLQFIASGL